MPMDHHDDDDDGRKLPEGVNARFKDFDCPDCNANNPCDPPIGTGDEVLCNYCGSSFEVKVTEEGRLKLKEM